MQEKQELGDTDLQPLTENKTSHAFRHLISAAGTLTATDQVI